MQKVLMIGGSEENLEKVERKMTDVFNDIQVIWVRNYTDFLALKESSTSFLLVVLGVSLDGYEDDLSDPGFLDSFPKTPVIAMKDLK